MKFDVMTGGMPLRTIQSLADSVADAGLDGLVVTEAGRTAYLSCAAAALAADIDLATGIAVAFPRSPMVTASIAWELADATGGRFRLGLGTQVRGHIVRRYGCEWQSPGPRMADYIEAMRACFAAFRGEDLDHHGDFYELTLLPAMWSPGPIEASDPPIDLAAVNPWMLRLAGASADGVHVHPLNTPVYLRETVVRHLDEGARSAGRSRDDLEVIVPVLLVAGDSDGERRHWREMARAQVAFYGSTSAYSFIFDQLGRSEVPGRLRDLQRTGDFAAMTAIVDDGLLAEFTVEGEWDGIADTVTAKYAGIATRVVDYFGATAWTSDPSRLRRWGSVASAVRSRGDAPGARM